MSGKMKQVIVNIDPKSDLWYALHRERERREISHWGSVIRECLYEYFCFIHWGLISPEKDMDELRKAMGHETAEFEISVDVRRIRFLKKRTLRAKRLADAQAKISKLNST